MKFRSSILSTCVITTVVSLSLTSCGTTKPLPLYLESSAPEESGLNLVKITDEANGSVIGNRIYTPAINTNFGASSNTYCRTANFGWNNYPILTISPDGTKLAYLTVSNKQHNIMVRNVNSQGMSTQRTFRHVVGGFCWGTDNKLYFADANHPNYYISSIDAIQGSVMNQHTNGNVDDSNPALSSDGKIIFFTRWQQNYGPSIWALNKDDGTLSSCCRGYNVCLIPGVNDAFYCVRNTTDGKSEIWYVNYVNGQESIVLSDVNRSFSNPTLSPDGKWLLIVGNSASSISKKQNMDIFAVRTDGTQLTQLTYHPETDCSPAWSKDGKSIFFISSRANKDRYFNIWRMNFNLN